MQEDDKSFLIHLRDAVTDYLNARLQLAKAQTFEKIAKVTGIVFSLLIIALLACFTILFVGLMLGFLIADLTHSNAIGFSVVGGLFIIMLAFLAIKREAILEKPIAEKIIKELFEDDPEDDEQKENPDTEKKENRSVENDPL